MKKLFLMAMLAIVATSMDAKQYIITECGTVHAIDDDATSQEIEEAIDRWTAEDCK